MGAASASLVTEGALPVIRLCGLGRPARVVLLGPTLLTAAGAGLCGAVGRALCADGPFAAAVPALAVTATLWKGLTPWPLRRLWLQTWGGVR
jgi:hypothetical protein